jgi:hypothetical protein
MRTSGAPISHYERRASHRQISVFVLEPVPGAPVSGVRQVS